MSPSACPQSAEHGVSHILALPSPVAPPKDALDHVDVLAGLARAGVQVFLTTHDYLLARRISLLSRNSKFPSTRFFAFYRETACAPVSVAHGDSLSEVPDNPMVDEFVKLYDLEVQTAARGD